VDRHGRVVDRGRTRGFAVDYRKSWIVGTAIPWLAAKGVELAAAFGQWILDLVVSLPGKLAGFITTVGGWIVGTAIPWLLQKGVELGGAFLGWVVDAALSLPGKLFNIIAAIGVWVTGTAIPWLINAGIQMGITFLGWILDAAIGLPLKLAQWIVAFGEWLVGTAVPWLVTKGLELAAAFGQWIFDFIVGLPGKLAGWITAIGEWVFGTAVPWVLQKGQDIASAFGQWILDTITSLPGKLAGIATAIADFLASLPGRVAEGAKSVGSAIWNGIVSGVTGAADAIGDIAQKLWNGLKGLINDKLIQPIRDFEVLGGHPFGDFPMLAEGAIVTKPTLAMVGEAGPELVLPLADPARTAQLVSDAAAAGLLPATSPVTATATPTAGPAPVASVGAAGAATGPVLSTESVSAWSVEITEIMVALPTAVTEQTMPLWQEWVTLTTDLFVLWSDGLLARNRALWAAFVADVNTGLFNAGQTMRTQLAAMNTGLGSALNTMVGTAASGAQRIGAALNAGLSNAVTTATSKVQGYGTKLAEAINPILAAIGQPPVVLQFASGGHVPGPRVNADVVPAMLTPGEYVLRRDVVDRVGTARLDALNEGRVQRFATGGSVLPADAVGRAQTFARQQAGEPYVWGSSGPDGYDCSGFWSAIINTIREPGRTPYRRLFNTASLIDGGWRNVGLLPGLGEVSVGAFKGNPGHMAGTIAGLNAESRGSAGVLVGPAARGAASPLFTNRYHMGNGLYLGENGTLYALPEPAAWGGGIIGSTGFKYEQFVHAKTKPWVTANTYTSNITAGMVATEPGVSLTGGWLPASSGKISEFGGPGDVNALAVTGGSTSAPPLGPYYAAMRWQTRNYSQLKNNRLKAVLPRTNRAVVMYPGDWGPAQWTGRVLDISPAAMSALGGRTDDIVQIVPVAANSRTGPVPVLHDGGVFTAPGGSREGLALLEHREEVVTRGDPRHVDNMPRGGSYTSRMDPGAVSELVAAMDRVATATVDRDSGLTVQVTAPETVSDPEHWGRLVGMRIRNARGRRR
jgi:cell wall-associated NlpC family hydrolase